MSIYKKFQKGLYTAASSFNLIWNNKKLLVYLGIPILAQVLIEILTYNLRTSCLMYQSDAFTKIFKILDPFNLINSITFIALTLIYLLIITLQNIALTKHTSMLYQKQKPGIRQTIVICIPLIKNAFIWALFLLIPTITFYTINTYTKTIETPSILILYVLFILSLLAFWSLITSFVIQGITIDNLSVIASIKKSIEIIKHIFLEFLGTIFWIGLIGLLSATPFMLLEKYAYTFYLITIPLVLIIYCTISSAYTVAKTRLYIDFNKK